MRGMYTFEGSCFFPFLLDVFLIIGAAMVQHVVNTLWMELTTGENPTHTPFFQTRNFIFEK
jgi:hypothetical protein